MLFSSVILRYLRRSTVRHVHWLRACAQKLRWEKKVILVGYEMQWTVRYFQHKMQMWDEHRRISISAKKFGAAAYAACQSATWDKMAKVADHTFSLEKTFYISPML